MHIEYHNIQYWSSLHSIIKPVFKKFYLITFKVVTLNSKCYVIKKFVWWSDSVLLQDENWIFNIQHWAADIPIFPIFLFSINPAKPDPVLTSGGYIKNGLIAQKIRKSLPPPHEYICYRIERVWNSHHHCHIDKNQVKQRFLQFRISNGQITILNFIQLSLLNFTSFTSIEYYDYSTYTVGIFSAFHTV